MLANRYELLRKIGSGGMAVVYQAYDTSLDRKVAIKLLREEYVDDPDFIRRFQKEAQGGCPIFLIRISLIFMILARLMD